MGRFVKFKSRFLRADSLSLRADLLNLLSEMVLQIEIQPYLPKLWLDEVQKPCVLRTFFQGNQGL